MRLDHFHFLLNHFRFCVCVSSDNPSNFLVQERSFDEGSDWKLAKLFLADSLSSCLTSWLSKVHTIKANIQRFNNTFYYPSFRHILYPLFLLGHWIDSLNSWGKLVICVRVCECLCVLSVARQCIKAGMWVSGVSKSSWSSWLQSLSVCLSFSLPSCHHCHYYLLSSSNSTSVMVFSSSPSSLFFWLYFFLNFSPFVSDFDSFPLSLSSLPLFLLLHSCNSSSSLSPPPPTLSSLPVLLSSICRSQQTWDIGVQTVTRGHRLRLPWLLPLLLWPWRQSKIHLTSSFHFLCPLLTS